MESAINNKLNIYIKSVTFEHFLVPFILLFLIYKTIYRRIEALTLISIIQERRKSGFNPLFPKKERRTTQHCHVMAHCNYEDVKSAQKKWVDLGGQVAWVTY